MRTEKNKSPLVLMEQVIMIVVFALATAICVKMFAQAGLMSKRLCATDRAVALCQTAAELLKAEQGNYEAVVYELTGQQTSGTVTARELKVYYKEDWRPAEAADGAEYVLCVTEEAPEGNVVKGNVQVLSVKDKTLLFGLPVSRQEVAYE